MTSRPKAKTRRARGGLFETEGRRDTVIVATFISLIVLLIVGLFGALGLDYYDNNIRPVASVGGVDIGPGLVRDRTALDTARLSRDEGRYRVLQQTNEITTDELTTALGNLSTQSQSITADSIMEELIDLLYQSQLAAQQGVSPSDADISAAVDREFNTPEQRHILIITVKPETTNGAAPTIVQRQAAMDRAAQALAAVQAGTDWATVASQYSDDPSAATGGDGGTISSDNPVDAQWTKDIFALPEGGTSAVVAALGCANSSAGDCVYRIARVTSITPGTTDQSYKDDVLSKVSLDSVRQIVGWELASDRLKDAITSAQTTGTVDQVHLAEIIIRNTDTSGTDDPTIDQGEIHFSQILFSPNGDPTTAADLPLTDPAWTQAATDATNAYNTLNSITDPQARADQFAQMAKDKSDDSATASGGGDVAFTTRSLLPTNVAAALFDSTHQAGDLLAPVQDETGWYVLLFHERRGSPQERLSQLQADIANGVDWNTLVNTYSDGTDTDKANGGDIGWFTQDMLSTVEADTVSKIFAIGAGQIGDPITFGTDSYIFKALDHRQRALDPDQVAQLEDPDYGAFANWYSDKKNQAETDLVITRAGQAPPDTGAPS
jgi:parvulin-like peptidyl-prolyl isomerase